MEWCVDVGESGASALIVEEISRYLDRHVVEPAVVELARAVIAESVAGIHGHRFWLTADWDDRQARLTFRAIDDGPLPGAEVGPGVTRAHEEAVELVPRLDATPLLVVGLGVMRLAERDIDLEPAGTDTLTEPVSASLLGLLSAQVAAGLSLEEAAARTGATYAARVAERHPIPDDAGAVARLIAQAEADIGGDYETVEIRGRRAVLRSRRCPFGPATAPSMCRFTSALAGGLGARAAGRTDVTVPESLAAGDDECRLVIDLEPQSARQTAHRYTWPLPEDPAPAPDPANSLGFQITLSLQLPRDRLSVPLTRHLVRAAMKEVGTLADDADAVELAVTEACANVIDHSGPGDAYEVLVTITPKACHIRVVDIGRGFDHTALNRRPMARTDAEHGRGVALMHILVDQVRFESEPEKGTVVHLVKLLHFDQTAVAQRMLAGEA